ncbi:hypothetical protein QPK87_07325 [Kamptonema cortianum]|nr:hypothetical protein [Kamptonema cortianum]
MYQRQDGVPVQIPDVGAPDERQHANYVSHLLEGNGFPVLVPGSPDLGETYQSHQPPLYYLLAAGWSKVTLADPTEKSSGFRLRLLNTLIGMMTLFGVFMACRWGLGRDDIGLASAAVAGLLPMSVALHSAVTNDPLLYCLVTWVLALCCKVALTGWMMRESVLIGVLTGLAFLTKTSALALVPVVGVALILAARNSVPICWKTWLGVPGIALVIGAPWWVRNTQLYGDPLGQKAFGEAFVGSPQASMFIEAFGASTYWLNFVLWWTTRSIVGVFGYMDIFIMESLGTEKSNLIYVAILFLLGVLSCLGVAGWKRVREQADDEQPSWATFAILNAVLFLVSVAFFFQFNSTYFQGQARYLFLALAPLATVVGLGCVWLFKRSGWLMATGLMLLLNVLAYMSLTAGFEVRVVT